MDAELPGGRRSVPAVPAKCLAYEPRLEFVEVRRFGKLGWLYSDSQVFWKMAHLDRTAPAEHECMFDDIFQLADITGKIVLHQGRNDIGRNADNRLAL